jgi:hypothetical protein
MYWFVAFGSIWRTWMCTSRLKLVGYHLLMSDAAGQVQ